MTWSAEQSQRRGRNEEESTWCKDQETWWVDFQNAWEERTWLMTQDRTRGNYLIRKDCWGKMNVENKGIWMTEATWRNWVRMTPKC